MAGANPCRNGGRHSAFLVPRCGLSRARVARGRGSRAGRNHGAGRKRRSYDHDGQRTGCASRHGGNSGGYSSLSSLRDFPGSFDDLFLFFRLSEPNRGCGLHHIHAAEARFRTKWLEPSFSIFEFGVLRRMCGELRFLTFSFSRRDVAGTSLLRLRRLGHCRTAVPMVTSASEPRGTVPVHALSLRQRCPTRARPDEVRSSSHGAYRLVMALTLAWCIPEP